MKPRKGRTLNESVPAQMDVPINPAQAKRINALLKSGMWGLSPRDVVRRLLDDALLRHAPNETPR